MITIYLGLELIAKVLNPVKPGESPLVDVVLSWTLFAWIAAIELAWSILKLGIGFVLAVLLLIGAMYDTEAVGELDTDGTAVVVIVAIF